MGGFAGSRAGKFSPHIGAAMKMRAPWLKTFIVAAIVLGASLTVLGLLAQWWPALDIVNNGLPFVAAGAVLILGLAAVTRDCRLILPAFFVATGNALALLRAS